MTVSDVVAVQKDWYRCRDCGKKFVERKIGEAMISCAVLHTGGCCHYGEKEAP